MRLIIRPVDTFNSAVEKMLKLCCEYQEKYSSRQRQYPFNNCVNDPVIFHAQQFSQRIYSFSFPGAHFRQRWVFAFMCFLGLFHAYAMRACLSITLTEMVITKEPDVTFDDSCPFNTIENVTATGAHARSREIYSWNEEIQVSRL